MNGHSRGPRARPLLPSLPVFTGVNLTSQTERSYSQLFSPPLSFIRTSLHNSLIHLIMLSIYILKDPTWCDDEHIETDLLCFFVCQNINFELLYHVKSGNLWGGGWGIQKDLGTWMVFMKQMVQRYSNILTQGKPVSGTPMKYHHPPVISH